MTTTSTPTRRGRGRSRAMTYVVRKRLIELVARGLPFRHACGGAGVSYSSFCEFRNAHPEFEERVQLAVSAAIEHRLKIIETAADLGDVGCAKWLLEHLHPEHFSRSRIELSGPDGGPIAGMIAVYLPEKTNVAYPVVTAVNGNETLIKHES